MSGLEQRVSKLEAARQNEIDEIWDKVYAQLPQVQLVGLRAAFALGPDSVYDLHDLEPYREQIEALWGDAEKHQALYAETTLGVCERLSAEERALIGWPSCDELAELLNGERGEWLAWHREAVQAVRW